MRKYFLSFIICFLGIGAGVFFSLEKKIYKQAWDIYVNEDLYLASLKEHRHKGCLSLAFRQPDVIFIGDSHAYSAWDMNLLQENYDEKIGACFMSGMFVDTLIPFLNFVKDLPHKPKKIVFSPSVFMFMDWPKRYKRKTEKLTQYIEGSRDTLNFLHRLLFHKGLNSEPFIPYKNFIQHVKNINAEKFDKDLKAWESKLPNIALNKKYYQTKRIDNWQDEIQKICHILNEEELELSIIHVPSSPLEESFYSQETKQLYQENIDYFKQCSRDIQITYSDGYDLRNKHFYNRRALEDLSDKYTKNKLTEDDFKIGRKFFDPDHMNVAGSILFTQKWLDINKK